MWKIYTVYADKIIVEGFHKIVQTTLSYFLRETDFLKSNPDPLFEAQLQLKPPEVRFSPSLNYSEADGFYEQIEGLIGNIYKQGSLIPRIAMHLDFADYQVRNSFQFRLKIKITFYFSKKHDLELKTDLNEMKQELMERVNSILTKSNEYKDSFSKYAYLWVDDRKEFMRQFLLYNHVLTPEEIEAHAETGGVPESPPTLDQFKEQVIIIGL
jgi:dynein heavy chain